MTISKRAREVAKENNEAVVAITIDRRTKSPKGGLLEVSGRVSDDLLARLDALVTEIIAAV